MHKRRSQPCSHRRRLHEGVRVGEELLGEDWGEAGFVKFARGVNNCNIYLTNGDVVLAITGVKDNKKSDPTTDYTPEEYTPEDEPEPTCSDQITVCKKWICNLRNMKKYCKHTCGLCDNEERSAGTVRCPDGQCRHVHMC